MPGAATLTPEMAAWLKDASVCPAIAAYVERIGHWASDEQRRQLRAFLPRLLGSKSPAHVRLRAEYLARRAITVFMPLFYEHVEQPEAAAELRAMPVDATLARLRDATRDIGRRVTAAGGCYSSTGPACFEAIAANAAIVAAIAAAIVAADDKQAKWADAVGADAAAYAALANAAYRATASAASKAAGDAIRQRFWQAALVVLDGVLAIGPAGGV